MQIRGVGVGSGVAVGPVLRMADATAHADHSAPVGDADAEFSAVETALEAVAADLADRGERAGGDARDILEASALMARDPEVARDIRARIDAGSGGQLAVVEAFGAFESLLAGLGGLMAERATDVADVSRRVVAQLAGRPVAEVPTSEYPFVLIAGDLAPADTALLDLRSVLALVTRDGGPTSHTAILARARSIPAVVGVAGALDIADGTIVLVDAAQGTITIKPSDVAIAEAHERSARVAAVPLQPGALADGTPVPLLANLGSLDDVAEALALGAEGVGLLRTEFLFANAPAAPSVDEQYAVYAALLSQFPGSKVVVRVLDAGADKPLAFLGTDGVEPNPALGLRGLRALRANERVLADQLEALARASRDTGADLWVMAPMVADSEEAAYFVQLARAAGIQTAGVMAEVPSVALMAEQVAAVTDFVSIGTNDLTQYTLAADRLLGSVSAYQNPWHPSVLRLVKLIGDAGAAAGTPVGVCGEAAADPLLAVVLVGLGATSLSMAPSALAGVRAALLGVTLESARAMAAAALGARSAAEARAAASAV